MKKFLIALMAALIVTFAASAQKTEPAPAKTPVPAPTPVPEPGTIQAEKKSAVIEREKFDPAKNPADDLKKAVEQASADGKRIILDLGGEWCVWCRYMDRFFTMNADLEKIKKENFVWVKINVSEENENKTFLSAYPEATGYPHFYVLDEKGQLLKSQSTDALESPKGYDLQKFTDFLKKWSPQHKEEQKADAPAVTH